MSQDCTIQVIFELGIVAEVEKVLDGKEEKASMEYATAHVQSSSVLHAESTTLWSKLNCLECDGT